MKSNKITYKHNVVHLVHLFVTVLLLFLVNLIALRFIAARQLQNVENNNGKLLAESIYQNLERISNINWMSSDSVYSLEAEQFAWIVERLYPEFRISYDTYESIYKKGRAYWSIDHNHLPLYNVILSEKEQLTVKLKEGWIDSLLTINHLSNYKFLIASNSILKNEGLSVSDFDQHILLNQTDSISFFDITAFNKISHGFSVPLNGLDYSIVFYRLGKSLWIYMINYASLISIFYLFILLLMAYVIMRINNRFLYPFDEILKSIEESKYLSLKHQSLSNIPVLLKRSFELLQNQLQFYEKNLVKSVKNSKKIEDELKIAKRLQNNILPKNITAIQKQRGFKLEAFSEAAFEIGGDLYDYYMLDDEHLLFVVGDVSGKGIPAALFMIYIQTLLRTVAKPDMSVSEIINELNDRLIEENISDLFVTMFAGIYNEQEGCLRFTNAAHNPPLIIRQEGHIEELADTHGIPLGIYAKRNYAESKVWLKAQDQLLVYTDGLIDTKDENGMTYSLDVLKFNLMGSWFLQAPEVMDKIKKSFKDFRGTQDPADDLTLLLLQAKKTISD